MTIKHVEKQIILQMKLCSITRQVQTQRHTTIDIREINLQLTLTMTMAMTFTTYIDNEGQIMTQM